MCLNHFSLFFFFAVGNISSLKKTTKPLPECSKLLFNKRILLLTTHIQISSGNMSAPEILTINVLGIFSSERQVLASGIAGEDVTINVLVTTLPTQGEFIISHKTLTI